jgi:carbon monoxide dehydrogenase subunit G
LAAATFHRLAFRQESPLSISLHRAFEVRRPVDEVWRFLTDPRCIAGCMPGAHLIDIVDDTLVGEVRLKLGPIGITLAGEAGFQELDRAQHSVLIAATAREMTDDGAADLRMRSQLSERGHSNTNVDVRLGVRLAGRLDGPILRRVLAGAAEILLHRFAACVRHSLEAIDTAHEDESIASEP